MEKACVAQLGERLTKRANVADGGLEFNRRNNFERNDKNLVFIIRPALEGCSKFCFLLCNCLHMLNISVFHGLLPRLLGKMVRYRHKAIIRKLATLSDSPRAPGFFQFSAAQISKTLAEQLRFISSINIRSLGSSVE